MSWIPRHPCRVYLVPPPKSVREDAGAYGHVTTKFSGTYRQPFFFFFTFLDTGLRLRARSSATNLSHIRIPSDQIKVRVHFTCFF